MYNQIKAPSKFHSSYLDYSVNLLAATEYIQSPGIIISVCWIYSVKDS